MIGFCAGYAWKFDKLVNLPTIDQMDIELKEPHGVRVSGHLIAVGTTAVLAYDFNEKEVRLLERANIKGIAERPGQIRWRDIVKDLFHPITQLNANSVAPGRASD